MATKIHLKNEKVLTGLVNLQLMTLFLKYGEPQNIHGTMKLLTVALVEIQFQSQIRNFIP